MLINILVAALLVGAAVALWSLSGRQITDGGVLLVGLLVLVGSWVILFGWIAGMTEGWLVPWDLTGVRPALGTWQRTVNDFFEGPPGSVLPSWVILSVSVAIFLVRFAQHRDRRWLPWVFAALNCLFVVALLIGGILAWRLPVIEALRAANVANDVGYHRTAAHLGLAFVLIVALFLAQALIPVSARGRSLSAISRP